MGTQTVANYSITLTPSFGMASDHSKDVSDLGLVFDPVLSIYGVTHQKVNIQLLDFTPIFFMEGSPSPGAISIPQSGDEDRFRFVVEQAVTGEILTRDLDVTKPKVFRALSGPSQIQFDVNYEDLTAAGIPFSPWGYWVHAEKLVYGQRLIWASTLVQPSQIDEQSGNLHLQAKGFSSYAKGIPWLQNWNALACDPFEVVQKVWDYLQSYSNSNLGVNVYPASSGLEMLPGYAFNGNIANLNFFAYFVRASDLTDCGDVINQLARDIPFDYIEQSAWNEDYSAITKSLYLGYPMAGAQQDGLAFIINENVIEAKPYVEADIDWCSDVIINGWYPGSEYSATFTNAPSNRYRRVISENDAQINSIEIAAAWAQRKLTKRQTPPYWTDISVIMGHPNAPFGTYDVGDRIWVSGYMPWYGDVTTLHKILAIQVNEEQGTAELSLMAQGAFNYAPVYYAGATNGFSTMQEDNLPNAAFGSLVATGGVS